MKVFGKFIFVIFLIFFFSLSTTSAQRSELSKEFRDYKIATFDSRKLKAYANSKRNEFIRIPFKLTEELEWNLELTDDKVFSDIFTQRLGNSVKSRNEVNLPMVLRGYSSGSNHVRATITVNDNFLYGTVETLDEVYFFEPLSTFDKLAKPDQIVIYKESDVIDKELGTCAATETTRKKEKLELQGTKDYANTRNAGPCIQVDLAIANDYSVYQNHGNSSSAVLNFNAGVIANVNTDYDDVFNNEISFVIVETYTVQSSGGDPWTSSTDASDLLNSFRTWAKPNDLSSGFMVEHDLGELWTKRDLSYNGNSSTIGLASFPGVCGPYRYHILEEYNSSAPGLRNLVSHEIGHNFNLGHYTPQPYDKIMSPSVSGTTTWHQSSIDALNSYLTQINCLGACTGGPPTGGGNPPVASFDATLLQECNPTRVQFNDLSTNSPTSWSWQFASGSPSTSTQENPIVDYPGGGSYLVTLTATNADGSDTKVLQMNLNNIGNPPVAAFTYNVAGNSVSFNNNSTNATTYSWNFGDGETSVTANPLHVYDNPGSYTVTLTSNNDCGTDTETQTVTITDQVTAAFSANVTEICEGELVTFTNQSSSNVTSYSWEFENGSPSTSTDENPTVTFNNSGTFNAKLTVSGGGTTDVENKTNYISVNGDPNAAFTETIDGYTVTFDNNTIGGFFFNWEFGDGQSSSAANPEHTYANSGTYFVTLTSTNDCGTDQVIREILIADEVTAEFTAVETEGCISDTYTFTSTSTGNITDFYWEFQDGIPATSTDENPTVTFDSHGTKTVRLTVSNSLYTDTENKLNYINIIGPPNVDFTFDITENTVVFDNNTTNGFFYNWDFGDGSTSVAANPTYVYSGPGDYIVTLTSSNNCDEAEISKTVSIESDIVASFIASETELCEGGTVIFTNTSEGSISTYFWEFEGGTPSTSTDENPQVAFNSNGVYDVKLTVSDGTLQDSENKMDLITIGNAPAPSFEHEINGYQVSFDNTTASSSSFSWDFGDGETSAATNPDHVYDDPGTYQVTLTATNDCGSNTSTSTIVIEEVVIADFSLSAEEICAGENVNFTNTSEGGVASYFWEFEGGNPATSEEENPQVAYEVPGVYNVKLTITGNFGAQDSKLLSDVIEVNNLPEPDFTYALTENTVQFNNLSSYSNEYLWDFGDGNTSTQENPTHTYATEGEYQVSLEVGGICGTDIKEISIPVFDELLANFQASETELCPGEEFILEDLSSGNPTEWVWTIMGDEMITLEEQNPTLVIDEPGVYTVELVVSNGEEEDSKVIQQYIEVMPLPEVEFTFTQDELMVSFDNNSENGIGYLWDFGDGTTSTEANPTHEYEAEGNYTVMLTVENSCSSDEFEQSVGVFNRLIVGFDVETNEICAEEEIQFIDQSSGNARTWLWSFPGGTPSTSTDRNPIVIYEDAGEYDVTLTVSSDNEQLTESKTTFIKVMERPKAGFEFEVDKNKVQFYNLSENGDSYSWSFGSSDLSPEVEFDEEKAYEISLVTSNGCASDTFTKVVDLFEEASTYANFSISANSYCLGDEISFVDLSSEDVTEWSWKFPGGNPAVSNEKNPTIMYEAFGTYDVELTVTNGFNTRVVMLEDYVTIVEKPIAGFELTQENNVILITNQAGHSEKVVWYINNEKINGEVESYTFHKNGIYTIKQVVENSCGSSVKEETVEVDVFPSAGFSLDVAQGCAPLTVNFESRSTDNADEVTWILEGLENPEVTGFTPTVTYLNPGNYGIKVIASNEFGSDTIELNSLIEVLAKPTIDFEYSTNDFEVTFSAITEGIYDEIVWDLGDGNEAEGSEVKHVYEEAGTYEVTATVKIGECSTSITEVVSLLSSSIEDIEDQNSIIVFPNPASDNLTIKIENTLEVYSVELLDQLGRRVYTQDVGANSANIQIDNLRSFVAGHYVIAIKIEGESDIYKKLVIVK